MRTASLLLVLFCAVTTFAQNIQNNPTSNHGNKFEQLGTILPDANSYRTGSGAPGREYWQQRADYKIDARLDEKDLRLRGQEEVTYFNNSPDELTYLWMQLDENEHRATGENNNFNESPLETPLTDGQLDRLDFRNRLSEFGVDIESVTDHAGAPLAYTVNETMMRIDLPKPLGAGQKYVFKVKWNYKIVPRLKVGGRGGYELFEGDGNCVFTISQWYPRMCVYSDYQGWNNKQFTGRGEFALVFGNYSVNMQVPADHVIASTGTCENLDQVLTPAQLSRWKKAGKSDTPVEVVTLEEAKAREKNPERNRYVTWKFKAENVRDFAWGSSRKFVWDAMSQPVEGKNVMCMSYYPKEAYALYSKYSTKVVAHTLRVYSKHTIAYPYPVAISVEASSGMEYPMIAFNYGRTESDGTYSARTKHGMISVVIHEVGHNFFPMIINSDERQWSWMDEGLNTFVQFLAEQEFDNNYPSSRGPAHKIVDYMSMPASQLEPIMTNSENIAQFGSNAYAKPATALNILRETVMGRPLFDYAFKEYARRWAFKHPAPADFFRTMEDASGVDLDWFWRGWFYDIQPVDISLDSVRAFTVGGEGAVELVAPVSIDPQEERPERTAVTDALYQMRNRQSGMRFLVDQDTTLRDFYYYYKPEKKASSVTTSARANRRGGPGLDKVPEADLKKYAGNFYYELTLSNKGGLVMPVIIQWNYTDGSSETEYIHAYIWRKNEAQIK
ncbi:MAG TPA: M1 family metallopeptidase, partial [Saprospiraceae bacterium]|nr:M1 family metallopeptidase [Saprospiraceae bacterium]HPI09099.1 M1 family metallopeptidase [Saprospiraceae bacterium]